MSSNSSKPLFIVGSIALLALSIAAIRPEVAEYSSILAYCSIAVSAILLILGITLKKQEIAPVIGTPEAPVEETEPEVKEPETNLPDLNAIPEQSAEVQVAQLLSLLQEKARFLDFVMDDITNYSDDQVAAAARYVHQGCQSVMKTNFSIQAVTDIPENQAITLEGEYDRSEYKLTGKVGDTPPFQGKLIHKGWKTTSISLPKVTGARAEATGCHIIGAAEVEVS